MTGKKTSRTAPLWLLIAGLVVPTLVTWLYFVALQPAPAVAQKAAYAIGKLGQFSLPVVCWYLVRRHPFRFSPPHRRAVLFGISFGIVIAAVMLVAYFSVVRNAPWMISAAATVQQKMVDLSLDQAGPFVALGIYYSIIHSLLEEYYWRWFVFGQLRRRLPVVAAIVVSAIGFMAHHVVILGTYVGWDSPATYLGSACVAIGGIVWAWLYDRTGSLYATWLSHLLIDAAIFAIGFDMLGVL